MKILIAGIKEKTKNYEAALKKLGVEVIVGLDLTYLDISDALLIPGGGDISPEFWGEKINGSDEPDIGLDKSQFSMLDKAVKENKPVFGICRGLQLINVYFGGSLYQDIASKAYHIQINGKDQAHEVAALEGTYIYDIYGKNFYVNSAHHQAIARVGKDLLPVLYSKEGIIEAVCHKEKKIYAVQFHPERMCFEYKRKDTVDGSKILEFFINKLS